MLFEIYLWCNLVGAMSWDDERGHADFQWCGKQFYRTQNDDSSVFNSMPI